MASFRRVLIKRVFNAVITILMIMLMNFVLFRVMPGDPAQLMTPHKPGVSDALYWSNVEKMGLNDSLPVQLGKYYYQTFTLQWGVSFKTERPVVDEMSQAIGWTLLLLATSTALTFIIGMYLGKFAAIRRGKSPDIAISGVGLFFYGMPVFWFAIVLLIIFIQRLHWFPTGGYITSGTSPFPITFPKIGDIIWHMILPLTSLVVGSLAGVILIMRSSLIDVLTEDYITTAYAKGLTERQVLMRHASPNARLPIVTTLAMDAAFILGGAFQVEYIFSYQGIGWKTIDSINNQDYPMLQFIFLIGGVAVVLANFLADMVLIYLDPRVEIT
jgi:peptide/nickel transport system permease protein